MDVKIRNPILDKAKLDEKLEAESEVARRRAAMLAADADLRFEGLYASEAAKKLGERWILGEISDDDLIDLTKAQLLQKFSE